LVEFYNYHGGGLETNRKGEKKKEGRTQGEKGAQSMKEKRVRVYGSEGPQITTLSFLN
jgi:hypothetical protein